MSGFTFIYISDIHIGHSSPEDEGLVLSAFIKDVSNQITSYDIAHVYVVVGGDLVWNADAYAQYEDFDRQVVQPLVNMGIERKHFVFTMGNHDCQQSVVSSNSLSHTLAIEKRYQEREFNDWIHQDKCCVGKFNMFKRYLNEKFSFDRYDILCNSVEIDEDWCILSLNTSLASFAAFQGKRDERNLGVDTRSLTQWLNADKHKKRILLMHHPQEWLQEWAEREINAFIKRDFDVVLTGHTHEQDILCNSNGNDSYIEIKAPQLFTTKKDQTLGYCFIEFGTIGIERIIYRQWSDKRHRFQLGSDFTEQENGIIDFLQNKQSQPLDIESNKSPKNLVLQLAKAKLEELMTLYSKQPKVWVDRYVSPERIDHTRRINKVKLLSEHDIINKDTNVKILAPVQYGLTCYGLHFVYTLIAKYDKVGIFVPKEWKNRQKLGGYIENKLSECNISGDEIAWVVVDDWVVTKKQSAEYLGTIREKMPNAKVMLLSPRLEKYFKNNDEIVTRDPNFESLYLAPLQRKDVRALVSAYNKVNYIDEEEKVLERVDNDMKDLNMHRTPINTFTLLTIFNNHNTERLINRTAVIEKILQMVFENDVVPNYKTIIPDMKDCEFVLGVFCKDIIIKNIDFFDKDYFLNYLKDVCKKQGIDLDIDYLFDVLYYNNVIKEFEGKYCFRHSFWVYYFAAMEMYRPDSELKEYIFKAHNYIHYPEVLEFYSGKDRQRQDAAEYMLDDIEKATQSVHDKVGWKDDLNLFSLLKCQQTEEQKEQIFKLLDDNVKQSSLPTEIKDSYADSNYNVAKPFDQSVRKFMHEYSVNYLMECIRIASMVYRNCDYVQIETKNKLLAAIFASWKVVTQIFFALSWPLAVNDRVGIEDSYFELDATFDHYKDIKEKHIGVVVCIPTNILNMFKDYLYSEKNSKMLLTAFNGEHDKIIKFLQAYIIALERPKDWNVYIDKYISDLGANTYYLGQLKDIMLLHLGHNAIKEEDEPRMKNLIKKAAYKLSTGKNVNSIQELNSFRITKKEENPNDENDATNEDKTPKM